MSDVVKSRRWTFLTNHAAVLLGVATNPEATLRELGTRVGITERAVRGILRDLEAAGYVSSERVGRGKRYEVDRRGHFRHPMAAHRRVGELLTLLERA